MTQIRRIINKCIKWEMINIPNPVSKIDLPKVNNTRFRFLSKEEATTLMNELKRRSVHSYRMAILGLYTGMRFGEVAALT